MLTEPAVKRLVKPEEVADLAVYLCGPGMSFANGSSFVMDGGWTAIATHVGYRDMYAQIIGVDMQFTAAR